MVLLAVELKVVLDASSMLLCVLSICHQEKNELDEQSILNDYLQMFSIMMLNMIMNEKYLPLMCRLGVHYYPSNTSNTCFCLFCKCM